MSPQQVRLRWTTHQGTLVTVLQSLLGKNCLVDVTLAAEGQYVRAHKVILCACSPYFEELLSISEDKHPIVVLQDVKYVELQALISYMYWGEVNIDEENLPSLLRIAEALQIRGLFGTQTPSDMEEAVDTKESTSSSSKCELRHDNSDLDTVTPVSKRLKAGHTAPGKTSSSSATNCETLIGIKDDCSSAAPDTYFTSGPHNSAHSSGKKHSKGEKNRFTPSQPSSAVECILNKDKDTTMESDAPEANSSFIFDNYFSNDERDEGIAPTSPVPDYEYKYEDQDQSQDGLQLGNGSDQIFRCIKCGKQYTSNKSLWRHRKFACDGKQTFSCQLCGKSFSRSDNLRRHAVVAHCIQ